MPPSDGSGNFSLPAGYLAVADTAILVSQHNPILEDIAAGLTARLMRNGAGAMTGALTLSGDPTTSLHAATKQYVDLATSGGDFKASVKCATTGNITLSGEQTLDGILTSTSRVLVRAQTAPAENGIYVSSAGAWSRASDMNTWTLVPSAFVAVEEGTVYADTLWLCTSNTGGTLGTTAITWSRVDRLMNFRATTGTSETIAATDLGGIVTTNNASAIAVSVPQATGAFGNGFWFIHQNLGAGTATDTPTTSTVNGAATLVQQTNDAYLWVSDGTNWRAIALGLTAAQTAAAKWPKGALSGLTLARASTTTYTVATGVAANEDGGTQYDMTLASAFTKSLSAWAVGSGNGSLDTGGVGATTWYHVHLIRKDSDATIDVLLSLSATAPTMPGGYTARRRIGSIKTDGSSQIIAFSQEGNEYLWDVATIDVDATNPGTAAVTRTLNVPTGVKTTAVTTVGWFVASGSTTILISALDTSDQTPQGVDTASLTGFATGTSRSASTNGWNFSPLNVRANTSAQVRSRVSASGAGDRIGIITRGWIDRRGQN